MNRDTLLKIQDITGYVFSDPGLAELAFTHKSFKGAKSNQCMEFFGDSILDFIVSEIIFRKYTDLDEGELTKLRAAVVSEKPLAAVIKKSGLNEFLIMGKNEIKQGINENLSVMSDLYEALLAAVYMDGGLEAAFAFVKKTHSDLIEKKYASLKKNGFGDYKSELYEFCAKHNLGLEFVTEKSGAVFVSEVYIEGDFVASGKGSSKKEAEQSAAAEACKRLDR